METLYTQLIQLYIKELLNLNVGYQNDSGNLRKIMDLINAIEYINNGEHSSSEILKILSCYGAN